MNCRRQLGFSSIEMMFVMALILLAAGSLAPVILSARDIERHSRVDVLIERDLRAGLLSIADVLRNVPEAELGGFDEDEQTVRPTFQRITSSLDGAAVLGATSSLEWRASAGGRSDDPGGVYLVEGGTLSLVAAKITSGSFHVYREGTAIRIEIEARRATGMDNEIQTRSGQIVVAMRN